MKRVIVYIDSLVLKGFDHEDRHTIAAGLQQELTQLFAEPQTAQSLADRGDVTRLKVGNIVINQGTKPLQVGVEAAQGIGREIKK